MRKPWTRRQVQGRTIPSPDRAKIDDPWPGTRPHHARSPARCEACGLAEPDHAVSVNGRAAEPINSVGGALSGGVRAGAQEPRARLEGCGSAMAENCTCSAFLGGFRRIPMSVARRHRSTRGYAPTANSRLEDPAAIAGVSARLRNHKFVLYYDDRRQTWLKPARLTPTFTSRRDIPRKFLPSLVSDNQHLQTIALCPTGLSAAVQRSDPRPSAPLPTP
jgi:hypothetical protein